MDELKYPRRFSYSDSIDSQVKRMTFLFNEDLLKGMKYMFEKMFAFYIDESLLYIEGLDYERDGNIDVFYRKVQRLPDK